MRKVLIIAGRYLPGYRDGGPVRTLINLTEWLGDEYDIRIMCLDRDHNDTKPYPGIRYGEYNDVGKARVWYTPKHSESEMIKLCEDADVVYVAGLYDAYARLAMKLAATGKIASPLYVAPMGSFSPEAFKIKGIKKRLFICYMKLTGSFRRVIWSVTSVREQEELMSVLGSGQKCMIATDLPRKGVTQHTHVKERGKLKLVFLSRICTKKNLIFVPDIIRHTDDETAIKLDIYGPAEDDAYLHECMSKLDAVKKTHPLFKWEYKGEADSEQVPGILAEHDAFIFPTLGENYGHVIAESMSSGCIPVISDTTPWLGLDEKGCGYVCALGDRGGFAAALDLLAAMSEEELEQKRAMCREYITSLNSSSVADTGYRKIFG